MYDFKRILVGLDLTAIDEIVIKYTNYLCDLFEVDKIYFFHVAKSFELPSGLLEKYPNLLAPVDETIQREIQQKVDMYFTNKTEYVIEVKEGNSSDQILRWADFKEIDLVIVGKKIDLDGEGELPNKLVKTSHCSLLFIPETAKVEIENIMIPLDFSKTGTMSLDIGDKLQKLTKAKLLIHHSYVVPFGYHTTGKTYQEFAEIMHNHAKNDLDKFIQPILNEARMVEEILTLDENNSPAKQINSIAKVKKADFLIIGSKGRSGIASLLIGSVAEKVCNHQNEIPLLVVKDKHGNMGLFEALLNL